MLKVLILTAAYGEGHNAAARGLQAAFAERTDAEAVLLDPFVEAYGAFYERSRRDYLEMIERYPRIWASVYELLDRTPLIHALERVQVGLRRRLGRIIAEQQPDVIVSVYPVFAYLINRLYPPEAPRPFRFCTVVTDSITINSVWHRSPSDLYFVPNEESAEVMRRAGVPTERLRVLGFPVPPRFARDRPERPPLETGGARVLYMINAAKASAPGLVRRLLEVPGILLTVTVGKDETLRQEIEQVAAESGKPVEIHGWTPRMPELLMTHHVLIGKAGGAAVQETIAARTPMLITKVVPGQEEGNARLLVENGCGEICETPEALAAALERLFAENGKLWREWEARIIRLSRPAAALDIAECLVAEWSAPPRT